MQRCSRYRLAPKIYRSYLDRRFPTKHKSRDRCPAQNSECAVDVAKTSVGRCNQNDHPASCLFNRTQYLRAAQPNRPPTAAPSNALISVLSRKPKAAIVVRAAVRAGISGDAQRFCAAATCRAIFSCLPPNSSPGCSRMLLAACSPCSCVIICSSAEKFYFIFSYFLARFVFENVVPRLLSWFAFVLSDQTSRFETISAFFSMNSLRGST